MHSIARQRSLFSTNTSLHHVLSTVRPSRVANRVPPDRSKLVTLIAGRLVVVAAAAAFFDRRRRTTLRHASVNLVYDRKLDATAKTTEKNLIERTGKFEAEVTNNNRLPSRYCTVKANY